MLYIIFNKIYLVLFIVFVSMPYLSNKYIFFGNTVSDKFLESDYANKIKKNYKYPQLIILINFLFISNLIIFLTNDELFITNSSLILILVNIIIYTAIWITCHLKVKKNNKDSFTSSFKTFDTSQIKEFKLISKKYYIFHLIFGFLIYLYTLLTYDDIPDKIKNINYDQIEYIDKSYFIVSLMPILIIMITLLFVGINIIIEKSKKYQE